MIRLIKLIIVWTSTFKDLVLALYGPAAFLFGSDWRPTERHSMDRYSLIAKGIKPNLLDTMNVLFLH